MLAAIRIVEPMCALGTLDREVLETLTCRHATERHRRGRCGPCDNVLTEQGGGGFTDCDGVRETCGPGAASTTAPVGATCGLRGGGAHLQIVGSAVSLLNRLFARAAVRRSVAGKCPST